MSIYSNYCILKYVKITAACFQFIFINIFIGLAANIRKVYFKYYRGKINCDKIIYRG